MSFSGKVKEELENQVSHARHCQIAELAALINMCGSVKTAENGEITLRFQSENEAAARKCFTLCKKAFNIENEAFDEHAYHVLEWNSEDSGKILRAIKLSGEFSLVDTLVVQRSCCRRAFVRGVFLAAGSISDPKKFYHFEIVCTGLEQAEQVQTVINSFEMDAKIVQRKKYYVVYIKEGAQIVDILNVMGAHVALMDLENVRILKEMRNTVNRKVNCETANINKTVNAAVRQVEDIQYIQNTIGLEQLSEGLEEIARLRLAQPEASLKELGTLLSPPVGKSGVNHRLRKLSTLAQELRENKEENYYD